MLLPLLNRYLLPLQRAFSALQRAFSALCLIILSGCLSPRCREWEFNEIRTQTAAFNAGRLLLCPDSQACHLELELTRNQSGIRLYINLFSIAAPPSSEDPDRSKVEIIFPDGEAWHAYPYLFSGGQRLLFPEDVANTLIRSLLDERPFQIKMGRHTLTAISENFPALYAQLLLLPIET